RFQASRLRQLLVHEKVWATAELTCAALWAPPGHARTTPRQDLELARGLLHPRLVWRLPLVARGLLDIQRHHPAPPALIPGRARHRSQRAGTGLGSASCGRCSSDATRTGWRRTWSPPRSATSISTRATA